MRVFALSLMILALPQIVWAKSKRADEAFYRGFTTRVRPEGDFKVPMPSGGDQAFHYELKIGQPILDRPLISDYYLGSQDKYFIRNFWDKMSLEDGSFVALSAEKIPLTCIYINGQDNRFSSKDTPLIPDFVIKVTLVANDYTCSWTGSIFRRRSGEIFRASIF